MAQSTSRAPFTAAEVQALVRSLPGWELGADGKALARRFRFRDFEAALDFANRLAAIANRKDHHPDLKLGWGYCEVLFTTHDAGGLTALDADSARETEALFDAMAEARRARRYRWSDIEPEQLNPSMVRRMLHGDRTLVATTSLKNGYRVPQHQHLNEQVTLVHSGTLRFFLGEDRGEVVDVGPGEVLVIPGSLPHEALCLGDVEATDLFAPVREDWLDGSDAYLRR